MMNLFDKDVGIVYIIVYLSDFIVKVMLLLWKDKIRLCYIIFYRIKEDSIGCIKYVKV